MNQKKMIEEDAVQIANSRIKWEKLEGKTVLISGATGYVPQYLVHALMKRNDLYDSEIKVIAMCRNINKAKERFEEYTNREDFSMIIQDIFEDIEIEDEIHYVIHAASPAGLVNSNKDPVETFKVNVFGADNLLRLAERKKSEFLLFSSIDVYGKVENGRFTESNLGILDTTDIRNVYAYSKRSAENLAICYSQRGVRVKIIRPSQIMGGGVALNDGRLHIDFISQMLSEKRIVLKGDGTPVRSFIYITDAITAILTVITKGENGQAYNICNENAEASVLELAQIMVGCAKEKMKVEFNLVTREQDIEVKHAISVVTASSGKIRKLGWRPEVTLEEASNKMMNYYGIETK